MSETGEGDELTGHTSARGQRGRARGRATESVVPRNRGAGGGTEEGRGGRRGRGRCARDVEKEERIQVLRNKKAATGI